MKIPGNVKRSTTENLAAIRKAVEKHFPKNQRRTICFRVSHEFLSIS
ncbi:hypothetical protein HOV93_10490 [Planctomycetes bacterium FF15]|uniref:Uncharacterized protein n=1 Tax=Bremerella alba TaxID=980252 RepID=A0A7V8V2X9_9BACT|nr:hypothetical protein [Bremerella alba]